MLCQTARTAQIQDYQTGRPLNCRRTLQMLASLQPSEYRRHAPTPRTASLSCCARRATERPSEGCHSTLLHWRRAVYPLGVEQLDLLSELFAEWGSGKMGIKGFLISETAFFIFIVMASRKLEADPLFTQYFNKETYSSEGFKCVHKIEGLKDLLALHYPHLAACCRPTSAFKLWSQPDPSPGCCGQM
mmetsp:Transcript_10850/g.25917  ORF Transcript_10850/g.25917 Transcript_10850/m.25917 type:complete len:188 (+) Transcript_10850:453-1016(+)